MKIQGTFKVIAEGSAARSATCCIESGYMEVRHEETGIVYRWFAGIDCPVWRTRKFTGSATVSEDGKRLQRVKINP